MNPDIINFSQNWAGKLFHECFTTIRLHNEEKYQPGKIKEINLKGISFGYAEIVSVKKFSLIHLSDAISYVDIGKPAYYLRSILANMYANKIPIKDDTLFDHVVLRYTVRNIANQQPYLKEWWQTKIEQTPHTVQQSIFND